MYESVELMDANTKDDNNWTRSGARQQTLLDHPLLCQSITPLALSLMGLLLTSGLLDRAQHWPSFQRVSELLLMVPVLLNMKGNLEMSVTGRLSLAIHQQEADGAWRRTVTQSGAILMTQSIISSFIVGVLSYLIGAIVIHKRLLPASEALFIVAVPIVATFLSAALNFVILANVIERCAGRGIDPDNVATPIAAALGDFSSIFFLCLSAHFLEGMAAVCAVCIGAAIAALAGCVKLIGVDADAGEKERNSDILSSGWIPIIVGLLLTSVAGLVLERFYLQIPSLPIMLPVINGISGGLLSIYVCRLMTALGKKQPALTFQTPLTLLLINLPLQLLFAVCVYVFKMGHGPSLRVALLGQLFTSFTQLSVMLYLGRPVVGLCIQHALDPPTYSLPILTAISDLLGTLLLIISYTVFLRIIK